MRAEGRARCGDVRECGGQRERMAVEMTRQIRGEDGVAFIGKALAPCDGRRIETRSAVQYEQGGAAAAARRDEASLEARAVSGDNRGARPLRRCSLVNTFTHNCASFTGALSGNAMATACASRAARPAYREDRRDRQLRNVAFHRHAALSVHRSGTTRNSAQFRPSTRVASPPCTSRATGSRSPTERSLSRRCHWRCCFQRGGGGSRTAVG
jgi:hypothetical protein